MSSRELATTGRVVLALGRRSVRQTFRRPQFLAPIILFPTLFLAVNTGGAGSAIDLAAFPDVPGFLDFQLAASTLQATMLAGLTGGIALAMDVESGFSDRIILSPIPRFAMVLGRLAGTLVLGALAAVWFMAIGLAFGAEIVGGVGGALIVIALSSLAAGAFGAFAAALALRTGRVATVQGVFPLVFVVLFLSSAFFPQQLLLEPAGTIARYNPFSFIAEGLRDPIISTTSAVPVLEGALAIALTGIAGIALSAWALRARLGES